MLLASYPRFLTDERMRDGGHHRHNGRRAMGLVDNLEAAVSTFDKLWHDETGFDERQGAQRGL